MKKPSGLRSDGSEQSLVDVAAIDQLAKIVSKYDLSEVEIDLGEFRVRLARERALRGRACGVDSRAGAAGRSRAGRGRARGGRRPTNSPTRSDRRWSEPPIFARAPKPSPLSKSARP